MQTLSAQSLLSWSHYRLLMRVEDGKARDLYLEECIKSNWSTGQLEREINTLSYQRYLLSGKISTSYLYLQKVSN